MSYVRCLRGLVSGSGRAICSRSPVLGALAAGGVIYVVRRPHTTTGSGAEAERRDVGTLR